MNGYIALYQGKRAELHATSLWLAVQAARLHFRVPKSKQGLLSVTLAEKNGEQVTHATSDIGA